MSPVPTAACLVGVVVAASLLVTPGALVAPTATATATSARTTRVAGAPSADEELLAYYKRSAGPLMDAAYAAVRASTRRALQDGSAGAADKAREVRRGLLPEVGSLLGRARRFQADGHAVAAVNRHLVASLRWESGAFLSAAAAYEAGRREAPRSAAVAYERAGAELRTWEMMIR